LSGGLDSSLLVAMMHQLSPSQLHTFSIGYEDHNYDEGQYAKAVSDHFNTRHLHVVLPQEDYEDLWLKLLKQKDAPLSIPHEIPLYQLSRELKRSVTVAISGEGADELFGGYGRVLRSPMDWKKVSLARSILGDALSARVAGFQAVRQKPFGWLHCRSQMEHFFDVYNWVPFAEKWSLMTEDVLQTIDRDAKTVDVFRRVFATVEKANPYDRLLHVFEKIHLGCLLDRLDAMTMAAGVEGRVPFVDHELVEFVINMPVRHKLRWNSLLSRSVALITTAARASEWLDTNKYLLRKLASQRIPQTISSRKKLGFPTPLDGWFRNGMMNSARDLLLGKTTRERGFFDHEALRRLLTNEQNLPYDTYGKKVWMLMNVELWFREFIDRPSQTKTEIPIHEHQTDRAPHSGVEGM
jgi:asparagine synthase (glutamine-hydrolysing)